MIASIKFLTKNKIENVFFDEFSKRIVLENNDLFETNQSCSFEITFKNNIELFRNHDYNWQKINHDFIANEYCPKIIKLENEKYVQSNINIGFWEINKTKKNVLLWHFNPENAHVFTQYSHNNNIKSIFEANSNINFKKQPTLLFTSKPLEFSRSPIPFSAITCFTDHCDFDTLENLKAQRILFKDLNIKTTKGFFINHFSKRSNNASFENDKFELELWHNDGHELCFHSLSQSIKSFEASIKDFKEFENPFQENPIWIDHGFQPYNFTMFKKSKIESAFFESILVKNKIKTLWNYIDSGTATTNVINQLNVNQFTLKNYWNSCKTFDFKKRYVMIFKNVIFHFDNNELRVRNYIDSISALKDVISKNKILSIFIFFKNFLPLIFIFFKTILFWNANKNKPYKFAKYQPLIFKHKIKHETFNIFQTLEMIDFKKSLNPKNIDLLINESGVFIAHTYFSANAAHYPGKMFLQENVLDIEVVENFKYLSNKIKSQDIWNPTLSQLISYWGVLDEIIFDVDNQGNVFANKHQDLIFRNIQ